MNNMIDANGKPIGNTSYLVPEPDDKYDDIHLHEFVGHFYGFHEEFVTIVDQDGDYFDIEPYRLIREEDADISQDA